MSHTRLWVAAAIIALVVIIGFVLSVPHTRDITETLQGSTATTIPQVTVRDSYKKGVHTITGTVEMPNACATVSAEANIAIGSDASSTPNILVAVTMVDDEGVCLQLPTQASFKTSVSTTTARLPLVVTINGAVATTTSP
ncbi:MAG: hypothetical protein Q7T37_00835 [bacterium]|nr:hypothetical protein [bacterium]MDO8742441.1 hypothetical protein [bacterium]